MPFLFYLPLTLCLFSILPFLHTASRACTKAQWDAGPPGSGLSRILLCGPHAQWKHRDNLQSQGEPYNVDGGTEKMRNLNYVKRTESDSACIYLEAVNLCLFSVNYDCLLRCGSILASTVSCIFFWVSYDPFVGEVSGLLGMEGRHGWITHCRVFIRKTITVSLLVCAWRHLGYNWYWHSLINQLMAARQASDKIKDKIKKRPSKNGNYTGGEGSMFVVKYIEGLILNNPLR